MLSASRRRYETFQDELRSGALAEQQRAQGGQEADAPSQSRKAYLRFYWKWLRPYRMQIAGVFAAALVASTLGLIPPYAGKLIIDRILQQPADAGPPGWQLRALHLAGMGVLVVLVIQQCIEAARNYRQHVLNFRVLRRLQQHLYEHLLRLPLHELQRMRTGSIVTRVSNDLEDVSGLLQMGVITPGVATFRVLATMAILVSIQWRVALLAVCILVPVVVINFTWIRKLKPLHRSLRQDRGEVNARVVETFGGIAVVRTFRREAKEARDFAVGQNLIIRKRLLTRMYQLAVTSAWGMLIPASSLLIIWYGGSQLLIGSVSLGDIVAFQMYVFMLMMPISQIVQSWGDTQQSLAALERTFDVLQRSVEMPDRPNAVDPPQRMRELRLESITFGYDAERPVLIDIDLTIPAGHTVALVGRSGAGKTTLTNLIARFYDPQSGCIRLDGTDLRDLKLARFRSMLGTVQQDVFLFDGTVRENIAYGRRCAGDDEIIEAARRAFADRFIDDLPDGYETIIGERGVKLSGGQKQRLSIARAILADPQVLLLDEATSNLDTESEELIQRSLQDLFANRTTIVIAHRLSTVTIADMIVVLDAGRIVETGTHAQLLARGGMYKQMVQRQMRFSEYFVDAGGAPIDWT